NDGVGALDVIGKPDPRADLNIRTHQGEVVVTDPEVHPEISHRREVVLGIGTPLAAMPAALKRREHIGITARIKEEALQLSQAKQVNTGFEHVAAPEVREIALGADSQRAAGCV